MLLKCKTCAALNNLIRKYYATCPQAGQQHPQQQHEQQQQQHVTAMAMAMPTSTVDS